MTILTDHNAARRDYEYDALVKEREFNDMVSRAAKYGIAVYLVHEDGSFEQIAPVEFYNVHTEGGHA